MIAQGSPRVVDEAQHLDSENPSCSDFLAGDRSTWRWGQGEGVRVRETRISHLSQRSQCSAVQYLHLTTAPHALEI
jgi:hypothetical protein